SPHLPILPIPSCPASWDEMQAWFRRAIQTGQNLAIAYPPPPTESPTDIWQHLVGIAKYLSRTGKMVTRAQLSETLGIGDRPLQIGFRTLKRFGFEVTSSEEGVHFTWQPEPTLEYGEMAEAIAPFFSVVQEEQFRRRYFYEVPLATIQAAAYQLIRT
ncbi:MAG: single-stranded-DNA-specific exonuclease RecJ, partial [Cyanobacteria bacterium CRU_2_1]|nr:single-stranded-DNA-specific exonuclease RecJ [Cyanobacteria bacterium CRU_2_1]